MSSDTSPKKGNKAIKVLLLIVVILLIIVATVAITIKLLNKGDDSDRNDALLDRGFVTESDAQAIGKALVDKVEEGMFECEMTMNWYFEDGGKAISPNAYVANSSANAHTMFFDVYVADTGELVYSSPLMPVGTSTRKIALEKELEPGLYDMEVRYTMVDENYEEISNVGFMIDVEVVQ